MTFAENMKYYRTQKGVDMQRLFLLTDIPVFILKRYETGKKKPRMETKERIAHALKLSIYALDEIQTDYETLFSYLYALISKDKIKLQYSEKHKAVMFAFQEKSLKKFLKKWDGTWTESKKEVLKEEACIVSRIKGYENYETEKTIAELLVEYRKLSGMSCEKLAEKADTRAGWIKLFENGQKGIMEDTWKKLSKALHVFPKIPQIKTYADVAYVLMALSKKMALKIYEEENVVLVGFQDPIMQDLLKEIFEINFAINHLEKESEKSKTEENHKLLSERAERLSYKRQTTCYDWMIKMEEKQ